MSAVLIVAAGRGTRAGTIVPKQYVELDGKTILRRTVEAFLGLTEITQLTVVIAKGDEHTYLTAMDGLRDRRISKPVEGGATRAASVRAGLNALVAASPDRVLIHDAARPFVAPGTILAVLKALDVHDGAFAAVPIVDAIWRADGGFAISPMDRSVLWRAQTPQGFRFDTILSAHRSFKGTAADDVEVARASGHLVRIVEGTESNFKITTPADLARARAELTLRDAGTPD